MKYANIIYFGSLNIIGGIETWLYNLSCLYKDRDILILVSSGNRTQIERLCKNVRIKIWRKERYECEKLFVCFNREILDYVKADKTYLVLHGDYQDMVNRKQLSRSALPIDKRIDEYIGVSQLVCNSWESLTGIKATLCYNPVIVKEHKKTIRLLSAQRLTQEKGFERIKILSNKLDKYCKKFGFSYIWDIYTDRPKPLTSQNVYFKQPRLDIANLYKGYDYFVSLTDNEGYCYSVVENLVQGVPCVVTDIPVFEELGLNEANSIKLDLKLKNIDHVIKSIFYNTYDFKYSPPVEKWGDIFSNTQSNYTYEEDGKMKVKVIALNTYEKRNIQDQEYGRIMLEGEEFEVSEDRLKVLLGDNVYKKAFVKLAEEKTEEIKEEKAPIKKGNKKNK